MGSSRVKMHAAVLLPLMLLLPGCAGPTQQACYETRRTIVEEAQILVAIPCDSRPADAD